MVEVAVPRKLFAAIVDRTFGCDAIHVRRLEERMSLATELVPALIVRKDEHDVGTRLLSSPSPRGAGDAQNAEQQDHVQAHVSDTTETAHSTLLN